jgi:hypothetical protein
MKESKFAKVAKAIWETDTHPKVEYPVKTGLEYRTPEKPK